jgi:hypothetical protein
LLLALVYHNVTQLMYRLPCRCTLMAGTESDVKCLQVSPYLRIAR